MSALQRCLFKTLHHSKGVLVCSSRAIRVRITRIPSDVEMREEEVLDSSQSENDKVPVRLINRNPRNLEQLQMEMKPLGFDLDSPSVTYWNKLFFSRSGKYLTAKVVHNSGTTLVSASSKEFTDDDSANLTDVNSAKYLGMVLARRCLESGILCVHNEMPSSEWKSDKVQAFFSAVKENGLALNEPEFIFPRRKRDL